WELTHGPIPAGLVVCHLCDTPACVRPSHLMLGTKAANSHDAWLKGRMSVLSGEHNGHARLTAEDIATIVNLRGHMSQRAIGARFGIHQAHVKNIQLGYNWKHIERLHAQPMTASEAAAKLTPEQVYAIRALQGLQAQRLIAQQFGISQQQVSRIHKREDWNWL